MADKIFHQLDPIIIVMKISDLLKDCLLEIIQQESVLTENIDKTDVLEIIQALKEDMAWFNSVLLFLNYLLERRKLNTTSSNLNDINEFINNCKNIDTKPEPNKSEIKFMYKNAPIEGSKSIRIDERGIFKNFTSPSQSFSEMINNSIRLNTKPESLIIDLKIDPNLSDLSKWPLGFFKYSNMFNDSQYNDLKLDLICSIIYFCNLLLNESLINLSLKFVEFCLFLNSNNNFDHKFIDERLKQLNFENLNILGSMCHFNTDVNYSNIEINKKGELIKQLFSKNNNKLQESTLGLGYSVTSDDHYREF
jgi:hypothetical protein